MTPGRRIFATLPVAATGQVPIRKSRRRSEPSDAPRGWSRWLGEPRNTVFLVLASALLLGGGRKLLQWWRARAIVARLGEPDLTVEAIEAASSHGRAPLMDLFRILTTAESEPLRWAAGRTLAVLWAQDNLIVEEEKALLLRGFATTWRARRRYPRQTHASIPIAVAYGIPFLIEGGKGVGPENLEWSHRIMGTRRAAHESFTPWKAGPGLAKFDLIPGDFDTNGPHRLVLQARVRTYGLTDAWELDLPQIPFHIEFDSVLTPDALFSLADASRGEAFARAIQLESIETNESDGVEYLPLNDEFAFRAAPRLRVMTPLPCDLAHTLEIEIEGIPGRFAAGAVIISGQGSTPEPRADVRRFPMGPIEAVPQAAIDRPGTRRVRAILTADPDRGWGDPDIRSIWPGTLETDWVNVEVARR
ncbi:hypothetical protein SAMN05444166_6623 [Singulisphaera sp. GP187]|uniref:hypothetical protein n=1 Tax=Singulisphaera sp. GP187 TaxID=1882752 RepID=UPI00092A85EE|nr:hypothetical protein [Singulisphaera sp. GP187]SIO61056.1 hypothetical protein SAMN05444166_6623 [Singulisphaera sp. GP187]